MDKKKPKRPKNPKIGPIHSVLRSKIQILRIFWKILRNCASARLQIFLTLYKPLCKKKKL